ncbi:MAG: DUF4340 domain-containing protein [Salinivirgaceae bacterium]|nr:DUF4340 domain-containing protein [Salinivirgaceae bacterium]
MKKRLHSIIAIVILLIVLLVTIQFLPSGKSRVVDLLKFKNDHSSSTLRSFHIRDTASITKIFLVDKRNRSITLERVGNKWVIDQKIDARRDAVQLLLETLYSMRVKTPVAISTREEVFRKMSGKSIKVEVYSSKKKIKTFYTGGVTQDNLGTYMLLENSDTPFIIEIPGFRGFVSSRFSTLLKNWRNSVLISEKWEDIKEIEINLRKHPEQGFRAVQTEPRKFELYNFENKKVPYFDTLKVKGFFEQFEIANFDRGVDLLSDEFRDSVRRSIPEIQIKLTDKTDSIQNYTFFKIPYISAEQDPGTDYYPQSMWAFNDDNDWVIIQTYTYLLMFRGLDDFSPKMK